MIEKSIHHIATSQKSPLAQTGNNAGIHGPQVFIARTAKQEVTPDATTYSEESIYNNGK